MDKNRCLSVEIVRLTLLTVFLVSIFSTLVRAEENSPTRNTDSLTIRHPHRKALAQALGIDLGLWAVDNYVLQFSWAKISMNSLRNNIKNGWVLDDDEFNVNQFGHPFQGAMVYDAARAQGLSFWQSVPYTIFSSFVWEMALETESPSINDMITTPLSGITFGEISHRMSLLALGSNPTLRNEIFAFLINPSLGMNRLFNRKSKNSILSTIDKKYNAGISFGGGGYLWESHELLFPKQFIRFHVFYGDPFDSKSLTKPFDYFSFVGILNLGVKNYVGEIYSSGILKTFKVVNRGSYSRLSGIFKNYDFMNHDDFKVSSSSIGAGLIQNFGLIQGLPLYNEIMVSGIILGSAGDTSDDGIGRDYYYGPGISGKLAFILTKQNIGKLYLRLKRYFIYNLEDLRISQYENVNLLKLGGQVHIWNHFSLGGEYTFAMRESIGSIYPNNQQEQSIFRLYLTYQNSD